MKELFKDRAAKIAAAGATLSLIGLIVYIILYGMVQRSMDSMSWEAVWVMGIGLVLAFALFAIKRTRWAAPVLAGCQFVSFLLYIYGMYPYISAAFVGIDSTWEVDFFVTLILFVAGLAVNIVAAFMAVGTVSRSTYEFFTVGLFSSALFDALSRVATSYHILVGCALIPQKK